MPDDAPPVRTAVLIPAAGSGSRLGGEPKQFRLLGGKPLLAQTLLVFERHPEVHYLIVSVPGDAVQETRRRLQEEGLTKLLAVVAGGATRQDSVGAALEAVPDAAGVVLVHDAVRPFLSHAHISALIAEIVASGAAALAVPVTDTVRRGNGRFFEDTISRADLFRMQTPQGFRREWFVEAHHEARRLSIQATDDVDLVQRLGRAVSILPGSARNMKITTPEDWELANLVWTHWQETF